MNLKISSAPGYEPYGEHHPIYLFSNEAHRDVFEAVSHFGSRVLSVTGGGDYIIGAFANGAYEVVGLDVNRYAAFFSELKIESIRRLNYEEFLSFWNQNTLYNRAENDKKKIKVASKNQFSMEMYESLRSGLKSETVNFFDELLMWSYKTPFGQVPLANDIFYGVTKLEEFSFLPYLSSKGEYLNTQKKLNELRDLPLELRIDDMYSIKEGEFDIINLSNMIDLKIDSLSLDNILAGFNPLLKNEGRILLFAYDNEMELPLIKGFSTRVIGAHGREQEKFREELMLRYCYVFTKEN